MNKYITDKFAAALTSINEQIETQNELRSSFPAHSKEYENSLKEELKLQNKKSELLRDL